MAVSKSKISALVAELNSRDKTEAKRAASELDALLYPKYGNRLLTAEESLRIDEAHYREIRDTEVVEPLLEAARNGTEFARAYACTVLGAIKDSRAIPLLIDCLVAISPVIRLAATKGIWFFRDPLCALALIRALQDSSKEVRCSAAFALGFIPSAEAVFPLMEFYETGDQDEKASALSALGFISDSRSLTLVRSALAHKTRKVRGAAKSALARYDLKRRNQA